MIKVKFWECIEQERVFPISLGSLAEVMFVFGIIWRREDHTEHQVRLGKNATGENNDWEFGYPENHFHPRKTFFFLDGPDGMRFYWCREMRRVYGKKDFSRGLGV